MLYIAAVRKGDRLSLTCTALDADGAGIAMVDSLLVHVAGALPGEQIEAELEHRSPHRAEGWARLKLVQTPSPDRREPACAAFGRCGGCPLEHFDYQAQLAWKTAYTRAALAKLPSLATVPVADCQPAARPLGYRNRSKLVYARGPGGLPVLGAFAPRSHQIVDLRGCRVAEPPLDEIAARLLTLLRAAAIQPYNEQLDDGELRHVVLRANHNHEVLCTFVTRVDAWPQGVELAAALCATFPQIIGVAQNVNQRRTNVIYGDTTRVLEGRITLTDQIGPVFLRLSATAFFQTHRDVAAALYADVLRTANLTGTERVVDCYAGVGGLALTLAPRAGEVIGIEENPAAVEDAIASAQLNHATRARFSCGDAGALLASLDAADVVILNPPRRGCEPSVLQAAAELGPRTILYVSCDPDTLARDLVLLGDLGWQTDAVRPYDMLPQTAHVEALAVLTRRAPG